MEVIYLKNGVPDKFRGSCIAIGNFDGVHRGHRKIIKDLKSKASEAKLSSAILTFEPHPIAIFNPEAKNYRISPEERKIELIEKTGIDILFIAEFDQNFSKISAQDFIENILIKELDAKIIFTGKDFIFGHNRSGNSHLLEVKSKELDYEYIPVTDINDELDVRFSSSRIRELIKNGDVKEANKMLSTPYTICGEVKKGRQDGEALGFPTANLELNEYLIPKFGVYSSDVELENGERYKAAVNIGIRPTFDEQIPLLEAHILDFSGDLYGKKIHVELNDFIRDEKKFNNIEELKQQIKKDISVIRNEP